MTDENKGRGGKFYDFSVTSKHARALQRNIYLASSVLIYFGISLCIGVNMHCSLL